MMHAFVEALFPSHMHGLLRFGPGFTVMLFECHIRVLKG